MHYNVPSLAFRMGTPEHPRFAHLGIICTNITFTSCIGFLNHQLSIASSTSWIQLDCCVLSDRRLTLNFPWDVISRNHREISSQSVINVLDEYISYWLFCPWTLEQWFCYSSYCTIVLFYGMVPTYFGS